MIGFLARRVAIAGPLLLGVLTLTFVLLELAPGDAGDALCPEDAPPQVRRHLERVYGLDRSPVERYARWLAAVLARGEWGWSVSRGRPVTAAVGDALPNTLALGGAALLLQLALGVLLGLGAARARDGWLDRLLSTVGVSLYAMPPFWVGMMAIALLAIAWPVFPASSVRSVGADEWPLLARVADRLWHLTLPASVLGVASAAGLARFVRAGVIAARDEPSVRSVRARGLLPRRVWLVHALRRGLVPAINVAGLSLPALVSGSLAVEVVFAWPGMGRLAWDAVMARDVPLVLAATGLTAALVLAGSLLADLAMAAVDPRIRVRRP